MYEYHPSHRDCPTEDERDGSRLVIVLEEVEEMETPSSCCPGYSTDEEILENYFFLSSGPILSFYTFYS